MFLYLQISLLVILAVLQLIHSQPTLKIVNGDEITPHSLPYLAALEANINERVVKCGGSLIRDDLVLTAASCVYGAEEVTIKLGAHDLANPDELQIELTSSNFTIHEDYDSDTRLNDIAIVRLAENVTLSSGVATISTPPLADILNTYADEAGMLVGWGKTNDTSSEYSTVPRKIEVTIIPYLSCALSYLFNVQTSQICTTGLQQGKNVCLGDTGSPLVVNGTQVGIVSYGSDFGCSVGAPGVHTRLTNYYFWLAEHAA